MWFTSSTMATRILIVDDHPIMCQGLRTALSKYSDVEVVGEATCGLDAVRRVEELNPDIVIMDVELPDIDGIEATRQIVSDHRTKIIAFSGYARGSYAQGMFDAGARAYLLKQCIEKELVEAINAVMAGQTYLSADMAKTMGYEQAAGILDRKGAQLEGLTSREREVLKFLAEGKTTADIADTLHVDVSTVKTHRMHLENKLKLHSTADLIKFAIKAGRVHL